MPIGATQGAAAAVERAYWRQGVDKMIRRAADDKGGDASRLYEASIIARSIAAAAR